MIDRAFWRGRRCFVTGDTGFKGAWLSLLLRELGAEVYGYSLPPTSAQEPLARLARLAGVVTTYGDINDSPALERAMTEARPDVLFHLAAQALVRAGYREPVATFETNVMGTARVLDAARRMSALRGAVIVTTDKCYVNDECRVARTEDDTLGGDDPYAASKACAELVAACFRTAYFSHEAGPAVATARAGNVVGGGDMSEDRIVPDVIRAARDGASLTLRAPRAVRPWQHVLDALSGYLVLMQRLCTGDPSFAAAWNFGPHALEPYSVRTLAGLLIERLGVRVPITVDEAADAPHEAGFLQIDPSRAREHLGWSAVLDVSDMIVMTSDWYRAWLLGEDTATLTRDQIRQYLSAVEQRSPTGVSA